MPFGAPESWTESVLWGQVSGQVLLWKSGRCKRAAGAGQNIDRARHAFRVETDTRTVAGGQLRV